ncbi:MAG TPA: PAS domain-containing protein [Ignavibacteriales bacterium]|nr:PAS domain-containing protein [Ignavibacteriales bacterium]
MDSKSHTDLSILQQSEHKYRSLFESMFEGFFLYEIIYDDNLLPFDYRFIELNDAALRIMGLSREKMIGRTLKTVLQCMSKKWEDYYSRAASGENLKFEEYSPVLNKHFKTILFTPSPGYLAALSIDITQKKKTEEALRLSEERLRYSLEAAEEGYWDWELKSDKIFLSPRYFKMLGYEPDEFELTLGEWFNMLHPDSRERIIQKITSPKFLPDNLSVEFQLINKAGQYRWILSHWKIFNRDESGCPLRILGTNSDITERKRIEEALKLNEHRINLILDTVPVAFFDIDLSDGFNIKWLSKSIERLTGFTPEEIMCGRNFWKSRIHKDDLPHLIELSNFPADLYQLEHRWKCADNKYKWFMYRAYLLRDKEAKPKNIIGLMQDISKSKSYEKKLKASEKQARALSTHLEKVREEERITLARDVHDELGQSLTVLKLMANSIKSDLLNGKKVDISDLDEMTTLISSTIKSVQRITTQLRPDILDTAGLIAAIQWQAETYSLHNKADCSLDLKDFDSCEFKSCIATVLFRTVQEALTNVSRHASATRVSIALKKTGSFVVLSVEDNGIGISSKELKKSTSFGLKGMHERASFAGGELSIRGRKGRGTIVKLKIPLERALTKYKS